MGTYTKTQGGGVSYGSLQAPRIPRPFTAGMNGRILIVSERRLAP